MFAVFVRENGTGAQIHTFSIKPDGTINKSWEHSVQVEAAAIGALHMMEMGQGYFVLAYNMVTPN
ncbi:unnamed protein product [marine sediment metagenome]|uniref:Uncharacterized protein n=1 Tax=marine sediment metagenome TaxID=412755 RepID=X1GU17_9ZZZZ